MSHHITDFHLAFVQLCKEKNVPIIIPPPVVYHPALVKFAKDNNIPLNNPVINNFHPGMVQFAQEENFNYISQTDSWVRQPSSVYEASSMWYWKCYTTVYSYICRLIEKGRNA